MDDQESKKVSITLTAEDKPLSMLSWGADAMEDYGNVYSRKTSENKDEQAAIWTSMYEKNLGRKVSDLPPWIDPSKADRKYGDPNKMDLASIHMQRAAESGAAHSSPIIQTAAERRHHRKHHKQKRSDSSGSATSTSSECEEDQLKSTILAFHDKISQGAGEEND